MLLKKIVRTITGLFENDEVGDMMPVAYDADFEQDGNGDLMPVEVLTYIDDDYELDVNGDIMPRI